MSIDDRLMAAIRRLEWIQEDPKPAPAVPVKPDPVFGWLIVE